MLKSTYYYIFNKDLTWLMRSELSGDYREIILLALESRTIPRYTRMRRNVSFEDERLDRDAFLAVKPTLPLGQVPVLEVDGTTYSQSMAIARYAAKLTGLYPHDPLECLRVDMASESLVDIKALISEITYRTPDETAKAEKTKKLLEESVPKTLKLLEGFNALGNFEGFSLDKYPKLAALVSKVETNANVAAYLTKHQK
ncbi:Glutathione S-transferase [Phytophthora palmivora]|uniref:Glutathione S-transferase n=1 Tax=Phytophthora palmivora TaxID=4796 RepID=A0A2P4YGP7_9STRA|nr:Glutathione S-transferase [Phytophthora palmivora]